MEPRIQYAKTSDEVNIAFYVIGEGPHLVSMSLPLTHLLLEWQNEQTRQIYETAARAFTVVRYDSRGFGLSDRNISDFTLAKMVRDLEAVADRLRLPAFVLFADSIAVPVAIAYIALNTRSECPG